jgi:hypothetical protein
MNEQIKQLWVQAAEKTQGDSWEEQTKFIERFAELIVQECISIAQDRAAFDWAAPNDVNHIISEIKEHFGVGDIPAP